MDEKKNKRNITKLIILIVSLMVLGFSGAYAYFTTAITGEPSLTKAKSGIFEIKSSLEKTSAINNKRMVLINEDQIKEKADSLTFTVTNTEKSMLDGEFSIYLKDIKLSKNLYSGYLKWELLDEDGKILYSGDFSSVERKDDEEEGEASNYITDVEDIELNKVEDETISFKIAKNTTQTFTFRMYLLNDLSKNQIELTEGSFKGRLYIEAVPIYDNGQDNTDTDQNNGGEIEQP